jgi:hypothetical protein
MGYYPFDDAADDETTKQCEYRQKQLTERQPGVSRGDDGGIQNSGNVAHHPVDILYDCPGRIHLPHLSLSDSTHDTTKTR